VFKSAKIREKEMQPCLSLPAMHSMASGNPLVFGVPSFRRLWTCLSLVPLLKTTRKCIVRMLHSVMSSVL